MLAKIVSVFGICFALGLFIISLSPVLPAQAEVPTAIVTVAASPTGARGGDFTVEYVLGGEAKTDTFSTDRNIEVDLNTNISITDVEAYEPDQLKRYRFEGSSPSTPRNVEDAVTITLEYVKELAIETEGGDDIEFDPSPDDSSGDLHWFGANVGTVSVTTDFSWDQNSDKRSNLVSYDLDGDTTILSSNERNGLGSFQISVHMGGEGHQLEFNVIQQFRLSVTDPGSDLEAPSIDVRNSPTDDSWFDENSWAKVKIDYTWDVDVNSRRNLVGWSVDGEQNIIENAVEKRRSSGKFTTPQISMTESRKVEFESVVQHLVDIRSEAGRSSFTISESGTSDEWYDDESKVVISALSPFTRGETSRFVFVKWIDISGEPPKLPTEETEVEIKVHRSYVIEALWMRDQAVLDSAPNLRVDVGRPSTIAIHYSWESDGADIADFAIGINGTEYQANATGWVNFETVSNEVGLKRWTTTSANEGANFIDRFIPQAIFDQIAIVKKGALDTRVNIDSSAEVWFKAEYDYDGRHFDDSQGMLFINGSLARWHRDSGRWIASITHQQVAEMSVTPSGVRDDIFGLEAVSDLSGSPLRIIWDRAMVEQVDVTDKRLNVGETVTIDFHLAYEFDREPITKGVVIVNDREARHGSIVGSWTVTASEDNVASRLFEIKAISGNEHGITALNYDAEKLLVIWDRLVLSSFGAEKSRIDVGTPATVWFQIRSEFDNEMVNEGKVTLSNSSMASFSSTRERWEHTPKLHRVDQQDFRLISAIWSKHGINALTPANENVTSVIWDRINVRQGGVDDDRINIGTEGVFWYKIEYEFDKQEFTSSNGDLVLSGSIPTQWSDHAKRWEYATTLQSTGNLSLSISEVNDRTYDLSSNARTDYVDELDIVWDSISMELEVLDERLDVGTQANFVARGIHEYDGSIFSGSFQLNDTATKETVGEYYYSIEEVNDEKFGISTLESNSVKVVFDQIEISIEAEPRVEVGTEAPFEWTGHYLFDGDMFQGSISLNDTIVKETVEKFYYQVGDVVDPLYKLNIHNSNVVPVIFDRILAEPRTETFIPGEVKVVVDLTYEYDGVPVDNAEVYINGVKANSISLGRYELVLSSFEPSIQLDMTITKPLFLSQVTEQTLFPVGNLISNVVTQIAVAAAIAAGYMVFRKRKKDQKMI
ncbi:MAG: hypothetical protein CMO12_03410 [Thaumarchaeota archaeon]|nr:hypothetical protein [Nitrososphaerota archaeon]